MCFVYLYLWPWLPVSIFIPLHIHPGRGRVITSPLLAAGWLRTGRNKNPINFQSDSDEWIQRPGSQSKPAANLTAEQVCCEAQGPPLIIQNFTGYFEVSSRRAIGSGIHYWHVFVCGFHISYRSNSSPLSFQFLHVSVDFCTFISDFVSFHINF